MPPAKQPEPTNETEISGFNLPASVVFPMGGSSVMIGNDFRTGMSLGGVVERIVHIGNGTMRLHIAGQERTLLVFSTGLVAETK